MWTYGKEQARILLTYKFKGESGFWTHSQKTCNKHHLTTPVIELLRTKNNVAQEQLQKRCYTEAIHPDCALVVQHMMAQEECNQILKEEENNHSTRAGCPTLWDDIRCWYRAEVGQVVNISCVDVSHLFANNQGYIYRNCTKDGWSKLYPSYEEACEFTDYEEPEPVTTYFSNFKQVYTAGYATSLIALISAIFVFTVFRKFHCTRNYIHINLFVSFILRASAVFIKDGVLFY
ncbi:Vasoactive intestinal polypeptide receptor 2 [Larimichthys crocea]|uniref:Uncharacterized protein n=1 Tax=Larimichthys crocea TaxID=215358 RepID=A0ACD3RKK7_LARCR|nr:Vasoactive intestinal polypeptide receptor 2 [Larimichthys crocea]